MHDPERDIRDIPLSQLELSPDNVRKTPADASALAYPVITHTHYM